MTIQKKWVGLCFALILGFEHFVFADSTEDHHEDEAVEVHLSMQAEAQFQITKIKVRLLPLRVPRSAVLMVLNEARLYRFRNGFYQRIDFQQRQSFANEILITSPGLQVGDEIATTGIGFLRLAEIAASGQTPDAHSH